MGDMKDGTDIPGVVAADEKYGEKFKAAQGKITENSRLIDDVMFRLVGEDKEVCQEMLRTLLDDPELIVIDAHTQENMKGLAREVFLDAFCKLGDGRYVNIEVQKDDNNNDIKRCRFHASAMTTNLTAQGTAFDDIPDVYVIYISEYDALENGQCFTETRTCQKLGDVYVPIEDGQRIFYANTVIKDGSDRAELLSLFTESGPVNSGKFPKTCSKVNYFRQKGKEDPVMCGAVREYMKDMLDQERSEGIEQGIEQGRYNVIFRALYNSRGDMTTFEIVSRSMGCTEEDMKAYDEFTKTHTDAEQREILGLPPAPAKSKPSKKR